MRLLRLAVILGVGLYCGSGCVAYQIRDELRITNSQLEKMDHRLDVMSAQITEMNASVTDSDHILNKSNGSLSTMESSMEPIRVSLRRIDDELTAFRQTLDKIDRYIPVNIKPDIPPPAAQPPTGETTPQKK